MKISVEIKDELLEKVGLIHIQDFLQRQLFLYELEIERNRILDAMYEAKDIDWEAEFDKAKEEAWKEYKENFLKNVK